MYTKIKVLIREKTGSIVIAVCLLMVSLLVIPFLPVFKVPVLLELVARVHPLILHFPIVAIILIALLELMDAVKLVQLNDGVRGILISVAALSAIAAIITGFLLYQSGGYSGELVSWHFYGGVVSGILTLITVVAFLYFSRNKKFKKYYLTSVAITTMAVSVTSHLGGSLTHGEDFLTEPIEKFVAFKSSNIKTKEEMILFDDVVMAFVDVKCMSCHNQNKMKGGYIMTGYDVLIAGGESQSKAVIAGAPDASELVKRVLLPADHEDRMPPKGKTPLSDLELEILKGWITQGASPNQKIGEIRDSLLLENVEAYLPELTAHLVKQYQTEQELEKIEKKLQGIASEIGLEVKRYEGEEGREPFFSLSMTFPPAHITDESLKKLSPYYAYFRKVSFVGSEISDDGLYLISKMKNLKELYLQKTKISTDGLAYLTKLPELEILNLSYTDVNDPGIIQFTTFPSLSKVYLRGNDVSEQVVEAARKANPKIQLLLEEGPYF